MHRQVRADRQVIIDSKNLSCKGHSGSFALKKNWPQCIKDARSRQRLDGRFVC